MQAPEPAPADPIAALFARQLASGLWEGDEGVVLATACALGECAENEIDTLHPVYGAQVKKAVEALCALADELITDAVGLAAALTAAMGVVLGKRLQAAIQAAKSKVDAVRDQQAKPGPS